MKKIFLFFTIISLLLISAYVYTQTTIDVSRPWSAPVSWKADPFNPTPGNDVVTIQSGNGVSTEVQISVDHNSTGVNIINCGGTTHLGPGSTSICVTDNPAHPIAISSDDLNRVAFGVYQLRTP